MFPFFLALYNGSQVSIVALWATCFLSLIAGRIRQVVLYMLGGNLGSLLYGDVSVMPRKTIDFYGGLFIFLLLLLPIMLFNFFDPAG